MSLDDRLRRGLRAAAHTATVDPDGDVVAGRGRVARHRRRARLLAGTAATVVVLVGAVTAAELTGSEGDGDRTIAGSEAGPEVGDQATAPPDRPPPTNAPGDERPPPVRVSAGDRSIELDPFTYCYRTGCADGMPPDPLPDIGAAAELRVDFGLPAWTFTASFRPSDRECGREETIDLAPTGDGSHVLRPAGPAGTYDVMLFGRGDGDAAYSFRWTTTVAGPVAEPTARLAVLADHDGRVDSYGVELFLSQLATTPAQAEATITVRAPNGREHTFAAPGRLQDLCTEGTLYWTGGMEDGLAAAALADAGPFTYEVVVTLDGVEHRATARWPDDQIPGNEPSVALHFTPALPGSSPP